MIKHMQTILTASVIAIAVSAPISAQQIMVGPDATYSDSSQTIIDQLKSSVEIKGLVIEHADGYHEDVARFVIDVANLTDKTIAGIRFYGQSIDIFGHPFENFSFQYDKDIRPNETATVESIQGQSRILKANQAKTKHHIQPIHIVFEDGSEIKDPRFR